MAIPSVDARLLSADLSVYESHKTFWERVVRTEKCWIWTGWLGGTDGRALFSLNGETLIVARAVWEVLYGPIPDGICVLHTCDRPSCVRPSHLFLGTRAVNNRDRAEKGRSNPLRGETNGNARLTAAGVAYIREHYRPRWPSGKGNAFELAEKFKVNVTTIYHIIMGEQWQS